MLLLLLATKQQSKCDDVLCFCHTTTRRMQGRNLLERARAQGEVLNYRVRVYLTPYHVQQHVQLEEHLKLSGLPDGFILDHPADMMPTVDVVRLVKDKIASLNDPIFNSVSDVLECCSMVQ